MQERVNMSLCDDDKMTFSMHKERGGEVRIEIEKEERRVEQV